MPIAKVKYSGGVPGLEYYSGAGIANTYSTTEHKTGEKWFDGKDVWEKVMYPTTVQFANNEWSFGGFPNTCMSDCDTIISASAQTLDNGHLSYYTPLIAKKDIGFYSPAIYIAAGSAITIKYTKITV